MGGVSLADTNQDLQQSFLAAKNFFVQVPTKSIKFVLIGLSPYTVPANDKEPPAVCKVAEKVLDDYIKLCLDSGAKPVCVVLPVNAAVKKIYNANVLKAFRDTINNVVRKYKATFIDLLDVEIAEKLFKDKAHLNSEGSAAVSALLGERLYFKDIISPEEIFNASKDFFNVLGKYFAHERNFWSDDRPLSHHIFCKMACEDFNRLSKTLPKETCMDLMVSVFSELTYSYLACLTELLPKDDYNELTTRIFNLTVENIRRKDKIKVGFYFSESAHWCGDDLYNLFAQDERFEPTVFVPTIKVKESYGNEFLGDLKKYEVHGLNVFERKSDIPTQDILFRLTPYPERVPAAFCLANLKVKETLVVCIPYSFILNTGLDKLFLYNVSWKMFFPSLMSLEKYKKVNELGFLRGIYSGYPKLDVFFKPDSKFHFDWKMTRPDAKKIIWAPHWSMNVTWGGSANFKWNHMFMYEFAKAHPEISWVVKPHPALFNRTVVVRVFPDVESCEGYFKKWDDLPNAQVYIGAYYQDIFATSDGMIHDSQSFIAEYQYVDKPMIYLTRGEKKSGNYLSVEIFKGSYLVDGKDFEGISAMIQRVIIEGDDYKAAERKAVFDKYLNYPKDNGMLASEFIYKNISDELRRDSQCKQ
ncbi:MAG: CDP-glycerol glycerophosphotransferase family protein [Selenomonadaceae bacterium]|nr:CDP-glycerol glycerophosphotransferase family protein [Selenomonadaceae bacterium]